LSLFLKKTNHALKSLIIHVFRKKQLMPERGNLVLKPEERCPQTFQQTHLFIYFSMYKTLGFLSNMMGERQEVYIRISRSFKHAI
jgi:hypothetical protein